MIGVIVDYSEGSVQVARKKTIVSFDERKSFQKVLFF